MSDLSKEPISVTCIANSLDVNRPLECSLGMKWEPIGIVSLGQDNRLVFPKASSQPALYRFHIRHSNTEKLYIGETENLTRRFAHYRNPGSSQLTNLRLNAKFKEFLNDGAEITVSVVVSGAWMDWGSGRQEADLKSKVIRCLFENMAISGNDGLDVEMLNRAQPVK